MSVLSMNPIPVFGMLKLPSTRSSEELADLIRLWIFQCLCHWYILSCPARHVYYFMLAEEELLSQYCQIFRMYHRWWGFQQYKNPDSSHYFGMQEEDVFFFHRTPVCFSQAKPYRSTCNYRWQRNFVVCICIMDTNEPYNTAHLLLTSRWLIIFIMCG